MTTSLHFPRGQQRHAGLTHLGELSITHACDIERKHLPSGRLPRAHDPTMHAHFNLSFETFNSRGRGLGLTERESEVISHAFTGRTDKEISLVLGSSPRTIQHQLASVYRKLGVHSRMEAARKILAAFNLESSVVASVTSARLATRPK